MRNRTKQLLYLIILFSVFVNSSCDNNYGDDSESQPIKQFSWIGSGGGFADWGYGGQYFYGRSVKPNIIDIWRWKNNDVEKYQSMEIKNVFKFSWLSNDMYLFNYTGEKPRAFDVIHLCSTKSSEPLAKYPGEVGFYRDKITLSRNGKYIAFGLAEDPSYGSEELDFERPRYRVVIMDPNQDRIYRLPELAERNPDGSKIVSDVAVSDDGKYAAVSGWVNGVAAFDVENKKILWQKNVYQLKGCIRLNDITFSPDSKYVYTGGGGGCLYKIEVQTGNVVGNWYATPSGEPEYAHRIYSVAASADGRFVAASMAPTGLTCIWYANTGKTAKVVNHGGGTIMIMFSPNSKVLATMGSGSIKIWEMPE